MVKKWITATLIMAVGVSALAACGNANTVMLQNPRRRKQLQQIFPRKTSK